MFVPFRGPYTSMYSRGWTGKGDCILARQGLYIGKTVVPASLHCPVGAAPIPQRRAARLGPTASIQARGRALKTKKNPWLAGLVRTQGGGQSKRLWHSVRLALLREAAPRIGSLHKVRHVLAYSTPIRGLARLLLFSGRCAPPAMDVCPLSGTVHQHVFQGLAATSKKTIEHAQLLPQSGR